MEIEIDSEFARQCKLPNFPADRTVTIQVPDIVWASYSGTTYHPRKTATASKPLNLKEAKMRGKRPSGAYKVFIRGVYRNYMVDEKYKKKQNERTELLTITRQNHA